MELQHRFTVPAPIDETWAAFNDLERVTPCFPGAALTSLDGDQFSGTVKIKLGPISMQYSGTGTFLERDEANHKARIEAKGKDKRGNGTANATVTTQLTADGDSTVVDVSTDLAITGKPAQFGRGVIQDVSDKLLSKFTACLSDRLGSAGESTASEQPPTVAVSPESVAAAPAESAPQQAAERAEGAPVAAPTAARQSRPGSPTRSHRADSPADDAGLDLFRTVAPVLARRYAAPVGAALVVLYLVLRLIRSR